MRISDWSSDVCSSDLSPALVTDQVLHDPAAQALPQFDFARASILSEARHIARGDIAAGFNPLSTRLAPAYAAAQSRFDWIGTTLALILAFAGGAFAYVRVRPDFRARTRVERIEIGRAHV